MTAQPYNRFVSVSWSWRLPCNGNQALGRRALFGYRARLTSFKLFKLPYRRTKRKTKVFSCRSLDFSTNFDNTVSDISYYANHALSENSACYGVLLYTTVLKELNVGNCALFSYRARYDAISFSDCTEELSITEQSTPSYVLTVYQMQIP